MLIPNELILLFALIGVISTGAALSYSVHWFYLLKTGNQLVSKDRVEADALAAEVEVLTQANLNLTDKITREIQRSDTIEKELSAALKVLTDRVR